MRREYGRLVAEAAPDGVSGSVTLISCSWEISELWACCLGAFWPRKDRLALLCTFVLYPDFLHGCLEGGGGGGGSWGIQRHGKKNLRNGQHCPFPQGACHLAGKWK